MNELIFNIYLVIEKGTIKFFRVQVYEREGTDEEKISFLKSRVHEDFESSYRFRPPKDRFGRDMSYNHFAKLAKRNQEFMVFEEIFREFEAPEQPLILVTPYIDGKLVEKSK